MTGLMAGIVTAASIWNLIIPALQLSESLGQWGFLPAFLGVWWGFLALLVPGRMGWKIAALVMAMRMGLPALMGITAGAALYLVVKKMVPKMAAEQSADAETLWFAAGFTLVMVLDALAFCPLDIGR